MKLNTVLRIDGMFTAPVGDADDMCADAVVAHALMQAIRELDDGYNSAMNHVRDRADELLREWGFEQEKAG